MYNTNKITTWTQNGEWFEAIAGKEVQTKRQIVIHFHLSDALNDHYGSDLIVPNEQSLENLLHHLYKGMHCSDSFQIQYNQKLLSGKFALFRAVCINKARSAGYATAQIRVKAGMDIIGDRADNGKLWNIIKNAALKIYV